MSKILIVEDDSSISEMYKIKFESEGFVVSLAPDGEEGLKKAKAEGPDLILLDVLMPKKDGTETLIELKKDPITKDIPVIFLTNLGGRNEDLTAARELGAEDLVVKAQTTPSEVVEKARAVLRGKGG